MPPHRRGFLFAHRAPAHALFDPALFLPNGDAIDEVLLGGQSRTSSGWDLMGNMRLMIVPRWLLYPMALLCGMVGVGAAEMVHVVNRTMPAKALMPKLMWNTPANLQPTSRPIQSD